MTLPIYQVDAFTNQLFRGNPAAVCPITDWPEDDILLHIAKENNLAETAYFKSQSNGHYHLRWFTPEIEIDLCGHATLASAYVIFEEIGHGGDTITFDTLSGVLTVRKVEDYYELDFPSRPPISATLPQIILDGLNIPPTEVWKARDYLLIYDTVEDIKAIEPNLAILNQINIDPGGIIVTAQGYIDEVDFVSRFFTPQAAIFEDPVTGSAHCTLVPYWAARLSKQSLKARQLSPRGGELRCELSGDRVLIKGQAVKYMQGTISIKT
jgi:predicted PhzF superfamily epimerase YddE/YHI9